MSKRLEQGEDYEKTSNGHFRLLKELSIRSPVFVPFGIQPREDGRYGWHAEEEGTNKQALQCCLECEGRVWTLHLPAGYHWDGASAPWLVRKLFDVAENNESTLRATLHHDAMYEGMRAQAVPPTRRRWSPKRRSKTRKWADRSMLEILKVDGYPEAKAEKMHLGVRRFAAGASKPRDQLVPTSE